MVASSNGGEVGRHNHAGSIEVASSFLSQTELAPQGIGAVHDAKLPVFCKDLWSGQFLNNIAIAQVKEI
jgi:hypothetical protein